ncbi:MAG: hypothetical protein BWK72_13885 [Rhodoferax ferrireducens]|uniref:DNA polymerase Y family protein n=1 Tax=Rhodoferax ferrireducens TaxID=192843 RepID=A0A1W9KSH7_9BURK|nr:MAG: hypothetical protein BWK72_13885 [Rhodoferax ferrireducens]
MHWIALQPQREAPPTATLTDPLTALGWWALQFTPKVALLQGVLLLEVSASTRLWGGHAALMRHIYTSNKPLALMGYAQGATSLVAYARLLAPCKPPVVPDDLPLNTLLAAQAHLPTLVRLGCTRWGDLRALPRDGLARRFGASLVDALDQAYGQRPDIYPWLTLPEVFEAALELPSQVENASALLFGARRLLGQMQVWLQLRQRGVLALELSWQMDARRNTAKEGALVLRTAEPALGTEHLQRLLAERLNQITLPAPVLGLRLRSLETQPLKGVSASLLLEDAPQGDTLAQLLERLGARLGAGKVLQLQAHADHRPEHMQAWVQAETAANSIAVSPYCKRARGQKDLKKFKYSGSAPDGWASALYPTWLLAQPLKLSVRQGCPYYQGPLTLLAGPQRLESGWWALPSDDQPAMPALRDYFVAASSSAVLLWIYRERLGSAAQAPSEDWYLQGVFA